MRFGPWILGLALISVGACQVDESPEPQGGAGGSGGAGGKHDTDLPPNPAKGGQSTAGSRSGGGADDGGKGGTMAGPAGAGGMPENEAGSHCGNNTIDAGEECDDGNANSGDGCSAQCLSSCETCEASATNDDFILALIGADFYEECYKQTDKAENGPAAGAPRAELCARVVDCVREQGCARFFGDPDSDPLAASSRGVSIHECWCTDIDNGDEGVSLSQPKQSCYKEASLKPGPCYDVFQAASEADGPAGIGTNYLDSGTALGRAATLLTQTDPWACPKSCPSTHFTPNAGGAGGDAGAAGL